MKLASFARCITKLLYFLPLLCSIAPAQMMQSITNDIHHGKPITVRGISQDGDSGVNSRTLQTASAQGGDSIILLIASQGQLCLWTAASWSSGTVTATLDPTDASSCKSLPTTTPICVGHATPSGYNGCFTVTGSSSTTVQYALASDPGGAATVWEGNSIDPVPPTDNAGNTYTFVGRTYVDIAIYIASNISLHTGATQPTITCALQAGLIGVTCGTIAVGGPSAVDTVSSYVQRSGVTTVTTPSIAGSVSPEFFVAFAGLFNATGNITSACGGVTFTNFNVGNNDGIGGYPPAYFVSSGTGSFCAGLSQNSSGDAWPIIVSFK